MKPRKRKLKDRLAVRTSKLTDREPRADRAWIDIFILPTSISLYGIFQQGNLPIQKFNFEETSYNCRS